MGTVAQHQVTTFVSPANGQTPIDATIVRGNDNTIRASYNTHDADPTIHLQNGIVSTRPAASTAGQMWLASDTSAVYLYLDTGSTWVEVNYLRSTGGTISGALTVTGNSTLHGTVSADNITLPLAGLVSFLMASGSAGTILSSGTQLYFVGGAGGYLFQNNANNATLVAITNTGVVTIAGATTITSGGLTVTAGGATITSGDLTVTAGFGRLGTMATANATAPTLCLSNTTAPSGNPSGGGFLYVVSGVLVYRGPSGTITTLAVA